MSEFLGVKWKGHSRQREQCEQRPGGEGACCIGKLQTVVFRFCKLLMWSSRVCMPFSRGKAEKAKASERSKEPFPDVWSGANLSCLLRMGQWLQKTAMFTSRGGKEEPVGLVDSREGKRPP